MSLKLGRYRHYKGGQYQVLGVARHSETEEQMVLYRPLYGAGDLWVRPLDMFCESVQLGGEPVPRFAFIGDADADADADAAAVAADASAAPAR
jgi:hypothetical protein